MLEDQALQDTYLVIDALDEYTTDLYLLLDLVLQESSTYKLDGENSCVQKTPIYTE
jgi:hypothetical protein